MSPYLDFDLRQWETGIGQASPRAQVLQLSATTGTGMPAWYDWLRARC